MTLTLTTGGKTPLENWRKRNFVAGRYKRHGERRPDTDADMRRRGDGLRKLNYNDMTVQLRTTGERLGGVYG